MSTLEHDISDALCLLAEYRTYWTRHMAQAAQEGNVTRARLFGCDVDRVARVQERLRKHLAVIDMRREGEAG